MKRQLVAILCQEGGKILSEFIRVKPWRHSPKQSSETASQPLPLDEEQLEIQREGRGELGEGRVEQEGRGEQGGTGKVEQEAQQPATGCVPCALGHFGTCSGLLNEAMRFARQKGMDDNEVIDRINMCLDELNAMERKDLRPQLIQALPEWEKKIANSALGESRSTRHRLESLKTVDDLESLAANTQTTRNDLGRSYFRAKLPHMSSREKEALKERIIQRLEQPDESPKQ